MPSCIFKAIGNEDNEFVNEFQFQATTDEEAINKAKKLYKETYLDMNISSVELMVLDTYNSKIFDVSKLCQCDDINEMHECNVK